MSIDSPTATWSLEDRLLIAGFHEEFIVPAFASHTIDSVTDVDEVGTSSNSEKRPAYHGSLERLWTAICQTSCWVSPYDGNDWSEFWGRFSKSPGAFSEASVAEIRRFLALATRGERFCEGLMANLVEKGVLPGALTRLKALNEAEAN